MAKSASISPTTEQNLNPWPEHGDARNTIDSCCGCGQIKLHSRSHVIVTASDTYSRSHSNNTQHYTTHNTHNTHNTARLTSAGPGWMCTCTSRCARGRPQTNTESATSKHPGSCTDKAAQLHIHKYTHSRSVVKSVSQSVSQYEVGHAPLYFLGGNDSIDIRG